MLTINSPTPEGLLIEEIPDQDGWTIVREVGKLGYVILEYRMRETDDDGLITTEGGPDVNFLLDRIADLETICARLRRQEPTSIDLPQYKWNLKKAKQRFRRWYQGRDILALNVRPELRSLVTSILAAGPNQGSDPVSAPDFLTQAYETGDIGVLEDYVRRKLDRPPLILSRIPEQIASLLAEANEAYRLGVFRAAAALCRATLERTLRMILENGLDRDVALPIDRDDLAILINSIPERLLKKPGRDFAHEIRMMANDALHFGRTLSEDEAWRLLVLTTRIVQALLDRSHSLKNI